MSFGEDIRLVAESLRLPFEKLAGSNILVTGSTGLIGSCIVKLLMSVPDGKFDVYAAGRNADRANAFFSEYLVKENFHIICFDVLDPLSCAVPFQYIIHAASYAAPSDFVSCPVEIVKANILGLSNLLDYGRVNGLRRLLYVSSGEVYGVGNGEIFDEKYSGYVDCTSPRSCYPSAKRAAESLCVAYIQEYGLDCVIARPCHVYGPGFTSRDNRAYAQFIRNAREGADIVMKSPGTQLRSWCYVVDCASALLHILLLGETAEAYNVADNRSVASIRDFAGMCAELSGCRLVAPNDDLSSEGFASRQAVYNVDKLMELGWMPQFSFSEGIKHSIAES